MRFGISAIVRGCVVLALTVVSQSWGAEHLLFLGSGEQLAAEQEAQEFVSSQALRFRKVNLNPALQSPTDITKGDQLILVLFDEATYIADVDRVNININGTVSIRGRINGYPSGYVLISTTAERSLGLIRIPEKGQRYTILSGSDGVTHYLVEPDVTKLDELEDGPALVPPVTEREPHEEFESAALGGPLDPAVIDVMVVYTPAARQWADDNSSGIANVIAQAMEDGQLALDNSDTFASIRLAHSSEVSYVESGSSQTDLENLTYTNDRYMNVVHSWRNTYAADLVALFACVEDKGGIAWLLDSASGRPQYGFSLTRVQQVGWTYTHIHEMGHNMGCHHRWDQVTEPGPGLFRYSAAWRWIGSDNGKYCSVMSYEDGGYTNVAFFSNPSVYHQGQPTGITNYADNARTIRETKQVIAAYRQSPNPPNDNFSNATKISGSGGQTRGNNAGATKESGEPSHAGNPGGASVWWCLTAPASGETTIDTFGSNFDTLLAVYTGSSVGSLTLVASNNDAGGGRQSQVTFNAASGTTYHIAVDGYNGATGNITLNLTLMYGGGAGTQANPYQIRTVFHWQNLMNTPADWNKCFILMADLDLQGVALSPVGNESKSFTGVFDGNGYVIRNAVVNMTDSIFVGLFGCVGGQIRNLGVEDVAITGSWGVGGMVGENGGSLTACYASGSVNGNSYVGGLVGYNFYGSIISCYATGIVSGSGDSVGGLVGHNYGSLSACYATGRVSSSGDYVGGLVGRNEEGSINACYTTGDVSGDAYVGGLVGWNEEGSINACYATGSVSGSGDYVGGLIGENLSETLSACYATGDVSGDGYVGGLVGENYGTLTDCYTTGLVSGRTRVGGLVGENGGGVTLRACYSTGSVSGSQVVGGLVGENYGTLDVCYATGDVSGGNYVGGLVGVNDGSITACYSTGLVSGGSCVGGLVGYNYNGSLTACYATGSVSGSYYVGGLVGRNYGTLTGCYTTGLVSGSYYVGGLLGWNSGSATASFWDIETSDCNSSAGGEGKTTAQMKDINTFLYAGWNFVTVWWMPPNDYPRLRSALQKPYSGGLGTQENPYQISTVADWQALMYSPADWNKHFVMTADIDLQGVTLSPIGKYNTGFTGVFDGNGYVIRNAVVNMAGSDYVGLFGYVGYDGQFRNLCVEDVAITGRYYVGGLVGWNDSGSITDCYATGDVSGCNYVGGLVGTNYGILTACYATGSVSGNYSVGGLVGDNSDSLTACYATGDVSGDSGAGGLVGENYGTITGCYATGPVSGSQYVGGLVGGNYYVTITNCYSTGSVSGYNYVGGLVGYNYYGSITGCYSTGLVEGSSYVSGLVGSYSYGSITACFWDVNTSGWTTSAGGVGKTTAQMKTKSTFTGAGWDFVNVWDICEGTNYPRFVWQIPSADWICPDGVGFEDFSYLADGWMREFGINDLATLCEQWLEGR